MDIVDEIRKDPESGARRLQSEYKAGLMALARRFCQDEGDAEELVNSTLAEVVASIDRYAEQSAFFAWMARILVRRHGHDTERKSNKTVSLQQEIVDAATDPVAESRIFDNVDASILRDAIEGLPKEIRDTLVMHYFMGIPVREAAKVLSVPTGTVAWRLHYARMLLAAKLGTAAQKPGGKALLLALLLVALTAAGAAVVVARSDTTTAMHNAQCIMHNEESGQQSAGSDDPNLKTPTALAQSNPSTLQPSTPSTNAASTLDLRLSTFDETEESNMNANTRSSIIAAASLAIAAAPGALQADILPSATPAATRQSIQDAIDAAAGENPVGTVTLGNGLFEIDAQLMVTNGVTLIGQGWDNTILKQVAATATANTRVVTLEGGSAVKHVTLTGGRVTGGNNQFGGGAFIKDGTLSWCCITNNTVFNNNTKFGGGVGFYQSKGQVDHSIIANNSAQTSTGSSLGGGGIGIYQPYGSITIDACLIEGNRSIYTGNHTGRGGGIGIEFMYRASAVTIRNTTIVGNTAGEDGGVDASSGGGVCTQNDSGKKFVMLNCIVAGNTTKNTDVTMNLNYSGGVDYCFFDISADKTGANSLYGNPRFVDAPNKDYHLSATSPAINTGTAWSGIGNDLDNRTFDAPPSMGCYEYFGVMAVNDPEFSPATGITFYPSLDVALSCETDGATIHYTTDGTDPTDSSPPYTASITLSATTTIKARAYKAGMDPSGIVSATYTYGEPTPPEFGTVTVTPRATSATISGTIASVGNNGATSCDVYLALGTTVGSLGEAELIANGATDSFNYAMPGLANETTYFYALSISNNATLAMGAVTNGQFTTLAESVLEPVAGDPAATRSLIQEEIDAAALLSPAGTVTLGEGLFEIDAQLMVTNGVALVGQGWEKTVVKQTTAGSTTRCATVSGGARIEGLTLTGGHTRAKFEDGAGVLVEDGTISWCCITNNQTGDASWAGVTVNNVYGAGVRIKSGSIDHSIIANNSAYMNGGGNSHGGGLGIQNPSGPVLIDTCLFRGNRAPNGKGGAIYAELGNYHYPLTVANNTASGEAGGVYVSEYYAANKFSFALANSILADNVAGSGDMNLALPGDDRIVSGYAAQSGGNLFANGTAALGAGSRNFAGSGSSWFVKPANGNYHLRSTAPAVGIGTRYEGIVEDLDHVERRKRPAAGCYEMANMATTIILM